MPKNKIILVGVIVLVVLLLELGYIYTRNSANRIVKFTDCNKEEIDFNKYECLFATALRTKDEKLCASLSVYDENDPYPQRLALACQEAIAKPEQKYKVCATIASESEQDLCLMAIGAQGKDFAACDKITSHKEECFFRIGWAKNNLLACKLSGKNQDWCYAGAAQARQQPKICNKIISALARDRCLGEIAINQNSLAICNQTSLDWTSWRGWCYEKIASANKDLSICDSIDDESGRNWCSTGVAKAKIDSTICDQIINDEEQNWCYYSVAKASNNLGLCGQMKKNNFFKTDDCYFEISTLINDYNGCDEISRIDWMRDSCLKTVGINLRNTDVCGKILLPDYQLECYSEIAKAKIDLRVCNIIQDDYRQGLCYAKIAEIKLDKNICDTIKNDAAYNECLDIYYSALAFNQSDATLCDKIESRARTKACFFQVAVKKNDKTICDNIESGKDRDDCYSTIGSK